MSKKSPYQLKDDINHVLRTGEGYTKEVAEWVGHLVAESLERQMDRQETTGKGFLRLSGLGTHCERSLWYSVNRTHGTNDISPSTKNKFIYGDLTEAHMLGLVRAAGHTVTGMQDELVLHGVKGHRDCIISGMLFDIKSASPYGYTKFVNGGLREDDSFGYMSQISSYLKGSLDDPSLKYTSTVGFLAMNKVSGQFETDFYEVSEELANKDAEVLHKIDVVSSPTPPPRPYEPVPHGVKKGEPNPDGNMVIPQKCGWCDHKFSCWDNLRTFHYGKPPNDSLVHFTRVVKEPKVREVTRGERHGD